MDKPSLWEITIIALIGGLLGVFFMVPLRNALIVKEHGVLPYPEGNRLCRGASGRRRGWRKDHRFRRHGLCGTIQVYY